MKNKYLSLVSEFHRAFNYRQPEPTAPDLYDAPTNALRPKLLIEEIAELAQAILDANRIEQLDALCDIQYVLSGAVLAWGYVDLFDGLCLDVSWPNNVALQSTEKLAEKTVALRMAADTGDVVRVGSYLIQLQISINKMIWNLGFTDVFETAFEEVHRSNMSKLWDSPDADYNEVAVFIPSASKWGSKWIGRRDDGKIVKSPTYSSADLRRFI